MSDKHQFSLLAQLCADIEEYHDDYALKSAAYGKALDDGFVVLSHLVADVTSVLPEFAEKSAVVKDCQLYVEYYSNPPKGAHYSKE